MKIIESSALMRSNYSEASLLETECLFGETVKILEEFSGWNYCKLETDNYKGWVKKKSIGRLGDITHRVVAKRSFLYLDKDPKSNCLFYLPMGSKLPVIDFHSDWAEINLHINQKKVVGYVPTHHIVEINHCVNDWVSIAQKLEGTPYKWGGRDTMGIDCAALLQLSYQTYGQMIPRNTSQQVNLNKKQIYDIGELKRGCVIFWKGHVAIMVDKLNCIHANAFHMMTKTEPLINVIDRMPKDECIIKMMDFN